MFPNHFLLFGVDRRSLTGSRFVNQQTAIPGDLSDSSHIGLTKNKAKRVVSNKI